VIPEAAGALSRRTGSTEKGQSLAERIGLLPQILLDGLTAEQARRTTDIAASHRLRGADAVYVATAEAHDALLVTWDQEMLDRGGAVVETMTPAE